MPFHTIAWSEVIAAAGTLQPIAAVADDQVFTEGDDFRIPQGLDNLLAAFALGQAVTRARIVAPSLRAFINHEIATKVTIETAASQAIADFSTLVRNPLPLAVGEFINFESDAGDAVLSDVTGVALLGDGPVQPREGEIRTIRAVATIAGAQRAWTSGAFVFSEDLPAGRYQVVGALCEADAPGAFRLIFREGGPRPGSISAGDPNLPGVMGARFGGWGVWGEFDINQPPTLEILSLGAAGTAQTLYLDLMRV